MWEVERDGAVIFVATSTEQLKLFAAAGRVQPTDRIRKPGHSDWMTAGAVRGLFKPPELPRSFLDAREGSSQHHPQSFADEVRQYIFPDTRSAKGALTAMRFGYFALAWKAGGLLLFWYLLDRGVNNLGLTFAATLIILLAAEWFTKSVWAFALGLIAVVALTAADLYVVVFQGIDGIPITNGMQLKALLLSSVQVLFAINGLRGSLAHVDARRRGLNNS